MDKFTSGRLVGADNTITNIVEILNGQPLSDTEQADITKLKPHSDMIIGEDNKAYSLKAMLENVSAGNSFDDSEIQATLSTKAPLASPAFTGQPTAPNPSTDQGIATKAYVDNLVEDSAFDDSAIQTTLSTKAPLASPTFTGQPTAPNPTTAQGLATKDYVDNKLNGSNVQMRFVDKNGATNPTESEQYLQIFNSIANAWEWVTYPLSIADVNYRTNRRTKDGAVIFARIFKVNTLPNNQEVTHVLNFVNNYVVSLKGWAYRANNALVYELPYKDTYQSSADILANVNGNKYLKIKTWGDRQDMAGLFAVEYC